MSEIVYSAGLMSQSFWFIEFKKIVKLVHEDISAETIKRMCLEENLFGVAKEYRAKRMYQYIINRVNTMDADMIALFMDSDIATQKLINLITILRLDRLYLEFIYEVYREKALLGVDQLTGADVMVFFKNKGMQFELIENWNDIHNDCSADYWPFLQKNDHILNAGVDINGFGLVNFHELVENNKYHKETSGKGWLRYF